MVIQLLFSDVYIFAVIRQRDDRPIRRKKRNLHSGILFGRQVFDFKRYVAGSTVEMADNTGIGFLL